MRSFISSSRFGTVPVSLAVALIAIGGYEGLLRSGKVPIGDGVGPAQQNIVKLEKFFYGQSGRPWAVAVGSSLTANLGQEFFGGKVLNLGMGGGSSLTGLEALIHSDNRPRVVLVEVSGTIGRGVDDALLGSFSHPVTSAFVSHLECLRQEGQPFNVAASLYKRRKSYVAGGLTYQSEAMHQAAVRDVLAGRSQPYSPSDLALLATRIDEMKRRIDLLQRRGSEVFLYMIPMEPVVDQSLRERVFADLAKRELPNTRYAWLPDLRGRDWTTNDGIHLIPNDAKRFAQLVTQRLQEAVARGEGRGNIVSSTSARG